VEVVGALVRSRIAERAAGLLREEDRLSSIEDLLARRPGLVVECAGHDALASYGAVVLGSGADLLIVSTGALADQSLHDELMRAAREGGSRLRIASGAIAALDWLGASQLAGLDEVVYRSRKPPRAWVGTPAPHTKRDAIVFHRSSVREAALLYPKNVNVAATLAIATLGFDRTRLELITDPHVSENIHEVEARGCAGVLKFRVENVPDRDNPRTSTITGMSVAHCILREQRLLVL
jgi:aspartate dehydrogenase